MLVPCLYISDELTCFLTVVWNATQGVARKLPKGDSQSDGVLFCGTKTPAWRFTFGRRTLLWHENSRREIHIRKPYSSVAREPPKRDSHSEAVLFCGTRTPEGRFTFGGRTLLWHENSRMEIHIRKPYSSVARKLRKGDSQSDGVLF